LIVLKLIRKMKTGFAVSFYREADATTTQASNQRWLLENSKGFEKDAAQQRICMLAR